MADMSTLLEKIKATVNAGSQSTPSSAQGSSGDSDGPSNPEAGSAVVVRPPTFWEKHFQQESPFFSRLRDAMGGAAGRMMKAVEGHGMPRLRNPFEFGNLFLMLNIEFPAAGALTPAYALNVPMNLLIGAAKRARGGGGAPRALSDPPRLRDRARPLAPPPSPPQARRRGCSRSRGCARATATRWATSRSGSSCSRARSTPRTTGS